MAATLTMIQCVWFDWAACVSSGNRGSYVWNSGDITKVAVESANCHTELMLKGRQKRRPEESASTRKAQNSIGSRRGVLLNGTCKGVYNLLEQPGWRSLSCNLGYFCVSRRWISR